MDFVGNNTWFAILLIIHIAGAIMGIGPTFAFGIMGSMAEKDPSMGLTILKVQEKIEKVATSKVYFITQPLSGIGMIFNRRLNEGFFGTDKLWLSTSILAYLIIGYLSYGVAMKKSKDMIAMIESGNVDGPKLMAGGATLKKAGMTMFFLAVFIVLMMIWKPGSGCGPLLRC